MKESVQSRRESRDQEARRRWGDTAAYKECEARQAAYTVGDKVAGRMEMEALINRFAALVGRDPADREVQELVGEWQAHITRFYYRCTPEILAGLGRMYRLDDRFRDNLDGHGEGTAELMSRAIERYCAQN